MALVVTIRVPVTACSVLVPGYNTPAVDDKALKAEIKRVLETSIRNEITPTTERVDASTPSERINLSISDVDATYVKRIAKERGLSETIICQQILLAAADRPIDVSLSIPEGAHLLQQAWLALEADERPEQAQFYVNLVDSLSGNHIGLVEGATGIGKTIAMLVAATDCLQRNETHRLVIAVPTLMLIEQFCATHQKLQNAGFPIPVLRPIIGKREFVSLHELRNLIETEEYASLRDAVNAWIASGGHPAPGHAINLCWLKSSLKQAIPEIPSELINLPEYVIDDDPGMSEYMAQFSSEDESIPEIMLCTHAMLAVHTKHKIIHARSDDDYKALRAKENALFDQMKLLEGDEHKDARKALSVQISGIQEAAQFQAVVATELKGMLPAFRHLLLDEAHLFESAMSNSSADYLSLSSFAHVASECVEAGILNKSAHKEIVQHLNIIRNAGSSGDTFPLSYKWVESGTVMRSLEAICAASVTKRRSANQDTQSTHLNKRLAAGRYVINSFLKNKASMSAFVRYSPVKAFPQLFSGVSSVDRYLGFLWASLDSAACVSATLYLRRTEDFSGWYQRSLLSIPDNRVQEFTPCIPAWCFLPVKAAYVPLDTRLKDGRLWLRPPTASDNLSPIERNMVEETWINELVETLPWIWSTAEGGVLVLLSSYDLILRLGNRLKTHQAIQDNLVTPFDLKSTTLNQDATVSTMAVQRREFLRLRHAGKKALWLATGSAWTGLDVGGHQPWEEQFGKALSPADDNVLTDLVVPRIPYGTNKSITHASRIDRNPGVPWEMLDAMFTLRQAIGRLVRRSGDLPDNRRIFLLDGRLNDQKFLGATTQALTILKSYNLLRLSPESISGRNSM